MVALRRTRDLKRGDRIVVHGAEWTVASIFIEGQTGHVDLDLWSDDDEYLNWHADADTSVEIRSLS
jgi:hypothetical protein